MVIKIWGKIMKDTKIVEDYVVISEDMEKYQECLTYCINEICDKLDIAKPYWLPVNLKRYNQFGKTAFNKDNFIEDIEFDKFVIEEIEEDDK